MHVTYVSNQCKSVFDNKHQAVLGISPFNSYFSEQRISYLYRWACSHFNSVKLYIPDEPTVFTLQAIGYDEQKANKKARRQCNYLKNKVKRALNNLEVSEIEIHESLICHSTIKDNEVYINKYDQCMQRFKKDKSFRDGCLSSTKWVLSNQLPENQEPTDDMLAIAVKYFMHELPMFLWSTEILNSPSAVFCYHQCPRFLQELFNSIRSEELIHNQQGFVIIEPK